MLTQEERAELVTQALAKIIETQGLMSTTLGEHHKLLVAMNENIKRTVKVLEAMHHKPL